MKRHLTIKIFFAVFIALLFSCASTSLNNDSETEITEKIEFPKPNAPYESKKLEVIEYKVNKDNSKNAPVTAGKHINLLWKADQNF